SIPGIGNQLLNGLIGAGVQPFRKQFNNAVTDPHVDLRTLLSDFEKLFLAHLILERKLGRILDKTRVAVEQTNDPAASGQAAPGGGEAVTSRPLLMYSPEDQQRR